MDARELSIPDLWEFTPRQFPDGRGTFLVWYDAEVFRKAVGYDLPLGQTNHSVSRAGTVRGVHWADVPPGQGKYVYCPQGAVLDVVVDIRVGSPTFGRYEAVRLDTTDYRALYLAPGLGHAFVALTDDAVLCYLCSERYRPAGEHGLNPMDAALDLPWPAGITPILSEKDGAAPTLKEAETTGLLPDYAACQDLYRTLRDAH